MLKALGRLVGVGQQPSAPREWLQERPLEPSTATPIKQQPGDHQQQQDVLLGHLRHQATLLKHAELQVAAFEKECWQLQQRVAASEVCGSGWFLHVHHLGCSLVACQCRWIQ